MMAGGRINNHAINYLPDEKTVILFVGYSAEGTPSRAIREGEKTVFINGERVDVNAQVRHASLSAHADQRQLLEWLRSIYGGQRNIRRLFLLHGDNRSRVAFAEKAAEYVDPNSIYLADRKDEFDLNSNQRAA
jgi:metallo-beta-lactamase family protein